MRAAEAARARTAPPAQGRRRPQQPCPEHLVGLRPAQLTARHQPARERERRRREQAQDHTGRRVVHGPAGGGGTGQQQQTGSHGGGRAQGRRGVRQGQQDQTGEDRHGEQSAQQAAGRLGAPAVQPVPGDRGDAVDQVVEAYLGQRLGARPEMEGLAVGQPEGGEGRLLVEG